MKSILARTAVIHLVVAAVGFGIYLLMPESVFTASGASRDLSPEALERNTRGNFMGIVALGVALATLTGFMRLYDRYEKEREKIDNPTSDEEFLKHVKIFLTVSVLVMIASSAVTYYAAVEYIHPLFEISLIYSVPTIIITVIALSAGIFKLIFSDPVLNAWDKFWTVTAPESKDKKTPTIADEIVADEVVTVEAK